MEKNNNKKCALAEPDYLKVEIIFCEYVTYKRKTEGKQLNEGSHTKATSDACKLELGQL